MFKHTLINYADIKNSSDMTCTKRRGAVRIFSFKKVTLQDKWKVVSRKNNYPIRPANGYQAPL